MAIYEVMTIGLDVALAAATTAAILCGLLGLRCLRRSTGLR